MTEYVTEFPKVYECDRCSSRVTKRTPYKDQNLCDICYQTHLGNIVGYGQQYPQGFHTLAMGICTLGNMILERMKHHGWCPQTMGKVEEEDDEV